MGPACEETSGLVDVGATVTGFVSENYWNIIKFEADSYDPFVVTLDHRPYVNCDLYVKEGSAPSIFDYSYADVSTDAHVVLEVPIPWFETWYIGVYGQSDCEYALTVTMMDVSPDASCELPCIHGKCEYGECLCNVGWAHQNCNTSVTSLQNGVVKYGNLSSGETQYFDIALTTNSSSFTVALHELNTQGMVWIYALQISPDYDQNVYGAGYASNYNYEAMDEGTEAPDHRFTLTYNPDIPVGTKFSIAVRASDYWWARMGRAPFQLVAFYTPFK